jgi:hypothetical protein
LYCDTGYWYTATVLMVFEDRGVWYCLLMWDDKDENDRIKLCSEVQKDQPLQEVDEEAKPMPVGKRRMDLYAKIMKDMAEEEEATRSKRAASKAAASAAAQLAGMAVQKQDAEVLECTCRIKKDLLHAPSRVGGLAILTFVF